MTCVLVWASLYVCLFVSMCHAHKHTHTHTNTCAGARAHIHTYIHTYIHTISHTHTHTQTRARARARTHTHTHTHTNSLTHSQTHSHSHTHTTKAQTQLLWLEKNEIPGIARRDDYVNRRSTFSGSSLNSTHHYCQNTTCFEAIWTFFGLMQKSTGMLKCTHEQRAKLGMVLDQ